MTTLTPTIPSDTDSQLLSRCLEGDRAAFRPLVERYQSLLCSIAYAIVGDLKRSEDVAQEAFIAAWRQLRTLQDQSRFRPWLCSIARNLAHHAIRRDRPTASLDAAGNQPSPQPTPVQEVISKEEQTLVWSALESLHETYREPLVLYYREDHSVASVAEALGLSENAVKQRLSRGREMLRQNVADRIESALRRSRPGPAFTVAVLAALPAVIGTSLTTTAKAATIGSAAAKTAAPLAKAAASIGFGSALLGMLGGVAGGALGYWGSYQAAHYQRQREVLKRYSVWMVALLTVFTAPFLAMGFGWHPFPHNPPAYFVAWMAWMFSFFVAIGLICWRMGRASRRAVAEDMAHGVTPLPENRVRRWLSRWEGRQYRSRITFLGLPLIHVNFGDPSCLGGVSPNQPAPRAKVARGWIAFGERAYGGLFAFGNIAVAPIALGSLTAGGICFGGLAVGLLPIGGLAAGLFPFGGAAIGFAAAGGLAIGFWAMGGGAVAWQAARGGFAAAVRYADAGKSTAAYAAHANDAIAKAAIDKIPFFSIGERVVRAMAHPWFIWPLIAFSLLIPIVFWTVGYRRRSDNSESPADAI
jgi:RNA polymerase sigma factor (sigma-70 family)